MSCHRSLRLLLRLLYLCVTVLAVRVADRTAENLQAGCCRLCASPFYSRKVHTLPPATSASSGAGNGESMAQTQSSNLVHASTGSPFGDAQRCCVICPEHSNPEAPCCDFCPQACPQYQTFAQSPKLVQSASGSSLLTTSERTQQHVAASVEAEVTTEDAPAITAEPDNQQSRPISTRNIELAEVYSESQTRPGFLSRWATSLKTGATDAWLATVEFVKKATAAVARCRVRLAMCGIFF